MRIASLIVVVVLSALAGAAGAQVAYSNQYPGRPGYPGNPNDTVSCGSPRYNLMRCRVPGNWRGARIIRQTSKSACVQGRTWGYDRGSIWVDKGCGAQFLVGRRW